MDNKLYTYKFCHFSDYSSALDKFSYTVMIYHNTNDDLYYILERYESHTSFIYHGKYKTLVNASKALKALCSKKNYKYYCHSYDCYKHEILNRNIAFNQYKQCYFL